MLQLQNNINMLGDLKTSQVTYVTIVPWEWERDATSSRGRYGNASSVTGYLKHDSNTQCTWHWQVDAYDAS